MAQQGFWPDPPSRRLAYDEDGTIVSMVASNFSSVSEFNTDSKKTLNDESGTYLWGDVNFYITFIFPEKRDITHYYGVVQKTYHYAGTAGGVVQWSNDTTTGMDGTWTTVASSWTLNSNNGQGANTPLTTPGFPDMRTQIQSLPVSGIKAIRFYVYAPGWQEESLLYTMHLYGHKTAGETPHRVDFCYADGAELVQDFDYGDQPRGSVRIWSPTDTWNIGSGLYLRNRSPDKVANDVVISFQNLTSNMVNRLTISKDNISYGTQVSWTEIQPLQIVGPLYVKHDVPDSTTLGLYTSRLKLVVGEWV